MANENEDLDLDVKQSSGKKQLIIFIIVGILLVGASVGATLFFLGGDKGGDAAEGEADAGPAIDLSAQYFSLDKMTVNFSQQGPARFLQLEIQVMARDEAIFSAIQDHMPVVRNDLLLLLAGQSSSVLATLEGKEQLRAAVLEAINKILKEQAGSEGIEAVYFTSFVMQ